MKFMSTGESLPANLANDYDMEWGGSARGEYHVVPGIPAGLIIWQVSEEPL